VPPARDQEQQARLRLRPPTSWARARRSRRVLRHRAATGRRRTHRISRSRPHQQSRRIPASLPRHFSLRPRRSAVPYRTRRV